MDELIHDNIWSLIHKNCHPTSCHSDIKYHTTLNMIFSVADDYPGLSNYPRRALHLPRSDAKFGGVHFYGPPHFGPLGTFFGFFLLNLGSTAPNYSKRPPMRSSKAPPNQKK